MVPHHEIEQRRLILQQGLDSGKSLRDRNRLGQFATPPALARAVVDGALGWLPAGQPIRFLDPAFGTGAFLSALVDAVPASGLAALTGAEIDAHYGEPARRLWAEQGLRLLSGDFTRLAPPEPAARPSLIVCNPPYVRHHHLERDDKRRLQDRGESVTGVRLSGLAGLYAHFMLIAHAWAADGAVAAWLVPSEFMDVNYGAGLRRYLCERVTLLHLHRFDPAAAQFSDALVSSAVLWWRHTHPPSDHRVRFSFGGSIANPATVEQVPVAALARETKWTRFPAASTPGGVERAGTGVARPGRLTLGDLFTIKRGIATGDNGFFILTPEQIAQHQLPSEFLRPILPGPRRLPAGLLEIETDGQGRPVLDRPLFLLDCRLADSELALRHPALWRYLQRGAGTVAGRYLCRHRTPWYAQEQRPPAPLLCTYMGRGGVPFRFIRNRSGATAPNVYLLMYPGPALAGDLPRLDRLWRGLNGLSGEALAFWGRVYGGGLHKLEPRELAALPVPGEVQAN